MFLHSLAIVKYVRKNLINLEVSDDARDRAVVKLKYLSSLKLKLRSSVTGKGNGGTDQFMLRYIALDLVSNCNTRIVVIIASIDRTMCLKSCLKVHIKRNSLLSYSKELSK